MSYKKRVLLLIPVGHGSFDYLDSTDYYFGFSLKSPYTTDARNYIKIPFDGTIVGALLHFYNQGGTAPSNEDMSYYVHTATADTLIATVGDINVFKDFNNLTLNIQVVAGDNVSIKITTPAWGTNPTSCTVTGFLLLNVGH